MSNTIRTLKTLVAGVALAAAFVTPLAQAEIAVIANPEATITSADQTAVQKLFLGKSNSIAGQKFTPVDRGESATKNKFYTDVVGKNSSQLRAYWSKRIFTGKGQPPRAFDSDADVVKAVAEDPKLIGYVKSSAVDSSVKVIMTAD